MGECVDREDQDLFSEKMCPKFAAQETISRPLQLLSWLEESILEQFKKNGLVASCLRKFERRNLLASSSYDLAGAKRLQTSSLGTLANGVQLAF